MCVYGSHFLEPLTANFTFRKGGPTCMHLRSVESDSEGLLCSLSVKRIQSTQSKACMAILLLVYETTGHDRQGRLQQMAEIMQGGSGTAGIFWVWSLVLACVVYMYVKWWVGTRNYLTDLDSWLRQPWLLLAMCEMLLVESNLWKQMSETQKRLRNFSMAIFEWAVESCHLADLSDQWSNLVWLKH